MNFQVKYNKTFLKELAKVPIKQRARIETFVFERIYDYDSFEDLPGHKKLKGFKNYYRIRFGDYRAGISYINNTLIFERVLHRKDIYKYYP